MRGSNDQSIGKHEQLYFFADKTRDTEALKIELERWLSKVTVKNEKVLKKTHDDIDGLLQRENTSVLS